MAKTIELSCLKCSRSIRVKTADVMFNRGDTIARVKPRVGGYPRHAGEEIPCPFHPGMNYPLERRPPRSRGRAADTTSAVDQVAGEVSP